MFINAVTAAIILGFLKRFAHINVSGALTGVTQVRNKPAPSGALIWRNPSDHHTMIQSR